MVLEWFGRVREGLEGVRRGGKRWEEVDGPLQHPKARPSVRPSVRRPSAVRPSVRRPSVRPSYYPNEWVCVTLQPPQTPSNSAVSWNVDACTILPQPLNPLSGIPEGSIDSIDRGSLRGDPLGLDRLEGQPFKGLLIILFFRISCTVYLYKFCD